MTELFQWKRYCFELFGLSCDVFADADPAILIDPQSPNLGYFSQTSGECSLIVSYGPEAVFNEWLDHQLKITGNQTNLVQPRRTIDFCGRKAEQVVLKIIPPPPAIGSRPGKEGGITIHGGETAPYLFKMIGAAHRQTPLLVAFKRPAADDPVYQKAETRFFGSFQFETG
jgi:hypothetical protein